MLTCILKHGRLTYLFLFGAIPMSSLVEGYFGTWNHRSLCCSSTSHLKIIETNIRHSHPAQHGRPSLAHYRGLWGMERERNAPVAWSTNETAHSEMTKKRNESFSLSVHYSLNDFQCVMYFCFECTYHKETGWIWFNIFCSQFIQFYCSVKPKPSPHKFPSS